MMTLKTMLFAVCVFCSYSFAGEAETVTDADGNVYSTVRIGNQVWTVENLRTTKFNDGTPIPHVTRNMKWWNHGKKPAYCYYNNSTAAAFQQKYGALYNFRAAKSSKIAPKGWRVPTDADWDTLQNYLIANGYNWDETTAENKIAKAIAAKSDWRTSTSAGTIGNELSENNSSGFSALPGGYRTQTGGFFCTQSEDGTSSPTEDTENCIPSANGAWWSSTTRIGRFGWYRLLHYNKEKLYRKDGAGEAGLSIRLIRDNVRPD